MFTLRSVLWQRGNDYSSVFTERAEDIYFETVNDLCYSIGYILKHVQRIDAEIPEKQVLDIKRIIPNYPIKATNTSGGNPMKWSRQYRIYFNSVRNMPVELRKRLQNDDKMRITGSRFIEACFYIGFVPGSKQDKHLIIEIMNEIFSEEEIGFFYMGYEG